MTAFYRIFSSGISEERQSTQYFLNIVHEVQEALYSVSYILRTQQEYAYSLNNAHINISYYYKHNNDKIDNIKTPLGEGLFGGNAVAHYAWGSLHFPEISTKFYNLQNTSIDNMSQAMQAAKAIMEASMANQKEIIKIQAHKAPIYDYMGNLDCHSKLLRHFASEESEENIPRFIFNTKICNAKSIRKILLEKIDLAKKFTTDHRYFEDYTIISYSILESTLKRIAEDNPCFDSSYLDNSYYEEYYQGVEDYLILCNGSVIHEHLLEKLANIDSIITDLLGDPRAESELWSEAPAS